MVQDGVFCLVYFSVFCILVSPCIIRRNEDPHHGVAAVVGQDHDINGRRVIGHADPSFLRAILSERHEGALLERSGTG